MRRLWPQLKIKSPLLRRLVMALILFPPLVALTNYDGGKKAPAVIEKKPLSKKTPTDRTKVSRAAQKTPTDP